MKKTLIASVVAAAAISGSVMAAEMPVVYGNIQWAVGYDDVTTDSGYSVFDNGSTIGVKHSHDISPGLTGFFKAEFEFDATRKSGLQSAVSADGDQGGGSGGLGETDEAYIGVKGDFGTILVGTEDTVYEWIDVTDQFETLSTPTEIDVTGEDKQLQYVSPTMNGMKVGISYQINGEDAEGNNHRNGVQLAAIYEMNNLTVAAALDTADGAVGSKNNSTVYALGVAYQMDQFGVAGSYETQADNVDVWSLLATANMGANSFKAGYAFSDYDSGAEANQISLQALHNVSDSMYVYVEGYLIDQDKGMDDLRVVNLGATYSF